MNQDVSELEKLALQYDLIPSLKYVNHDRDNQNFYDFVKSYANQQGMKIYEIKFSFLDELRRSCKNISLCCTQSYKPTIDTMLTAGESISRIILMPFLYPITGGGWAMQFNDDIIHIAVPKWDGIKFLIAGYKNHEYLHAYNAVLAKDLKQRGLITVDGFYGISNEFITPAPRLAPTQSDLKSFERKIIKKIIHLEKKKNMC